MHTGKSCLQTIPTAVVHRTWRVKSTKPRIYLRRREDRGDCCSVDGAWPSSCGTQHPTKAGSSRFLPFGSMLYPCLMMYTALARNINSVLSTLRLAVICARLLVPVDNLTRTTNSKPFTASFMLTKHNFPCQPPRCPPPISSHPNSEQKNSMSFVLI